MKLLTFAIGGVLALALSVSFIGVTKAGPVEIESDAGVISMVATVEDIDVTNQLVTVVGPNGNWVVVKVEPEHIELIELQERITISYADEVAVALRNADGPPIAAENPIEKLETRDMNMTPPTVEEQDWVEATPHGATDLTTIEISDTIAAINRHKRTITFAGTDGKTRTIVVGPQVQGFNQVEVGDRVVLLVTRAVAIDIRPA